ncbi:MAG: response regulator transcription factor [Anaerolineae bacterium]|nr:response regulator transcription factor [Anaerolineae bacterium]
MSDPIRILVVEDHDVVRKGLCMVLRLEADFEVVGDAGDGRQALALAAETKPDLVLLDLIMPEMGGKETALELRRLYPDIKIIILTGTEVDAGVMDLLEAGVDGYLLKEIRPEELRQAIRAVMGGDAYLHPSVTRQMLNGLAKQGQTPQHSVLTPRELEVLHWIATSKTYRQIAEELCVSEETIRSHAKNILSKLNQPNRAQAVFAAIRAGLINLPEN